MSRRGMRIYATFDKSSAINPCDVSPLFTVVRIINANARDARGAARLTLRVSDREIELGKYSFTLDISSSSSSSSWFFIGFQVRLRLFGQ